MNTQPTPRTDEQHAMFPMGGFTLDFCRQLERELAEARKQRDTLAEALEMVATHTYADGQCDNGYSPQYVAKQALAAAKGGQHE